MKLSLKVLCKQMPSQKNREQYAACGGPTASGVCTLPHYNNHRNIRQSRIALHFLVDFRSALNAPVVSREH